MEAPGDFIKVSRAEFLEQNQLIESLSLQVKNLEEERNALQKKVEQLKRDNANLHGLLGRYTFIIIVVNVFWTCPSFVGVLKIPRLEKCSMR